MVVDKLKNQEDGARPDIDKGDYFYRHATTYNANGLDIYRDVLTEILKEREIDKATAEAIKVILRKRELLIVLNAEIRHSSISTIHDDCI